MRRFLARFGWPLVALALLVGLITQWGLARYGPDRKVSPDEVRAVSGTLEAAAAAYITALLAQDCGMAKALVIYHDRDEPRTCRTNRLTGVRQLKPPRSTSYWWCILYQLWNEGDQPEQPDGRFWHYCFAETPEGWRLSSQGLP